jgi:hypothetical protein
MNAINDLNPVTSPIVAAAHPATPFTHRVRTLALAATLAMATLSVSAMQAHATDNAPPADPGVRCAAKLGPGEYEFYLPGAKVTDVNGNKWVCGPDGQWFRDYSAAIRSPQIQLRQLPQLQQIQQFQQVPQPQQLPQPRAQFGANSSATLR